MNQDWKNAIKERPDSGDGFLIDGITKQTILSAIYDDEEDRNDVCSRRLPLKRMAFRVKACAEVFDKSVLQDLRQIPKGQFGQRPPLKFRDGTTVTTCPAYLRAFTRSRVKPDSNDQMALKSYQICHIGHLLKRKSLHFAQPYMSYARALGHRLDWRSFGSSLGPRLVDESRPQTLFNDLVSEPNLEMTDRIVRVDMDDFFMEIQVAAVADLNKLDGAE